MVDETWNRITRSGDIYRVHGADQKRKRERRGENEEEKEFKEFLHESEKETGEFKPEQDAAPRPSAPTRTMLDLLSTGTPPLFDITPIEEPEAKKEEEKKEEK